MTEHIHGRTVFDLVTDLTPQLGGDLNGQNKYALQLQNIPDLASKGAGYEFNGVDAVITAAHDANIDITTNDHAYLLFQLYSDRPILPRQVFDSLGTKLTAAIHLAISDAHSGLAENVPEGMAAVSAAFESSGTLTQALSTP